MMVLDTSVLVYAAGSDHALREPCQALLKAVGARKAEATTTIEVIQEFTHVHGRRRERPRVVAIAKAYLDMLSPLLMVEEGVLRAGLNVFATHERIGSFDSVLAAAARSNGATALVSSDKGFSTFTDVPHVFPDESGVKRLIEG